MDPAIPKTQEDNVAGNEQSEVKFQLGPLLRVYKDGRVERLMGAAVVSPNVFDPATGVSSKDVLILPDLGVSARLYIPKDIQPEKKLPVLVYFHGGAFCIESAFSPTNHGYLNTVVSLCGVVAISVNYRLAPEHRLPAAYEDCWAALKWVITTARDEQCEGEKEPWLAEHADLGRLFIAGDSAGGNICHWVAVKAGGKEEKEGKLPGEVEIEGMVLVHPYFSGKEPLGSEPTRPGHLERSEKLWKFLCMPEEEGGKGMDHPWLNPWAEGAPSVSRLGCRRVLLCAAEEDLFRDRTWLYYNKLRHSGWPGEAEIIEIPGEKHVFHLQKPPCDGARQMLDRLAAFINGVGVAA